MIKFKKKKKTIVALALTFALIVTGAFAFLTATDVKVNNFTVGNVKIKVVEPVWDSENPDGKIEEIIPTQIINKDPAIKNTGSNDAYVYMRIWMPIADGLKVVGDELQADGTYTKAANDAELFTTIKTTTGDSGKWVPIDEYKDVGQGYNYYLYAYTVPVAPGETTGTLFDQIETIDIVEGIENIIPEYQNIVVEGFAIQSDYEESRFTYETAWDAFVRQKGYEWPDNPVQNRVSYYSHESSILKVSSYKEETDTLIINQEPSINEEAGEFLGWVGDNGVLYQNNTELPVNSLYVKDENETILNINLNFTEFVKYNNAGEGTNQVMLVPNTESSYWSEDDPCTTVINRFGKTVSDYEDGVSEWFVYGLEELMNEKYLSYYIKVQGDGYYTIEPYRTVSSWFGTGTKIHVWNRNGTEDTSDDTLAETLYLVVFGDLNGDSISNGIDISIEEEIIAAIADKGIESYYAYSGLTPAHLFTLDMNKNKTVDMEDSIILRYHTLGLATIKQTDGILER